MQPLCRLTALVLIPYLASSAFADAPASGTAKGKGKHLIHGQVLSVQMDAGQATGTMVVQVQHHKKKGATAEAPAVKKTFKISTSTKFEVVSGKKGAAQQSAVNASALEKGQHVLIHLSGSEVSDVKIVKKGKGKSKST